MKYNKNGCVTEIEIVEMLLKHNTLIDKIVSRLEIDTPAVYERLEQHRDSIDSIIKSLECNFSRQENHYEKLRMLTERIKQLESDNSKLNKKIFEIQTGEIYRNKVDIKRLEDMMMNYTSDRIPYHELSARSCNKKDCGYRNELTESELKSILDSAQKRKVGL